MNATNDKLGAVCSGLCVCHCLLTPLLITIGGLGAFGSLLQSERLHLALLVPVVLLALLSFPASIRRYNNWWPGIVAAGGISLLIAAQLAGHEWETVLTVPGGVAVAVAHWLSYRQHSGLSAASQG